MTLSVVNLDLFKAWENGYVICIPTNGFIKKMVNVMGAGVAKEVKKRLPKFPAKFGAELKERCV